MRAEPLGVGTLTLRLIRRDAGAGPGVGHVSQLAAVSALPADDRACPAMAPCLRPGEGKIFRPRTGPQVRDGTTPLQQRRCSRIIGLKTASFGTI